MPRLGSALRFFVDFRRDSLSWGALFAILSRFRGLAYFRVLPVFIRDFCGADSLTLDEFVSKSTPSAFLAAFFETAFSLKPRYLQHSDP